MSQICSLPFQQLSIGYMPPAGRYSFVRSDKTNIALVLPTSKLRPQNYYIDPKCINSRNSYIAIFKGTHTETRNGIQRSFADLFILRLNGNKCHGFDAVLLESSSTKCFFTNEFSEGTLLHFSGILKQYKLEDSYYINSHYYPPRYEFRITYPSSFISMRGEIL